MYSTSPRNRNPTNGNHLDQSLRSSEKNRNSLTWVLDLSLSGLDPVPLSKIGTHLLASLGGRKNRNSLACLRNTGSHSAVTYCTMSWRPSIWI